MICFSFVMSKTCTLAFSQTHAKNETLAHISPNIFILLKNKSMKIFHLYSSRCVERKSRSDARNTLMDETAAGFGWRCFCRSKVVQAWAKTLSWFCLKWGIFAHKRVSFCTQLQNKIYLNESGIALWLSAFYNAFHLCIIAQFSDLKAQTSGNRFVVLWIPKIKITKNVMEDIGINHTLLYLLSLINPPFCSVVIHTTSLQVQHILVSLLSAKQGGNGL